MARPFVARQQYTMDNVQQPIPFRVGSSDSSENLSDKSYRYAESFTGEPAEYDPQVSMSGRRLL